MKLGDIGLAIQLIHNTLKEYGDRIREIPGFVSRSIVAASETTGRELATFATDKAEQIFSEHRGEFETRIAAFRDQTLENANAAYHVVQIQLIKEIHDLTAVLKGELDTELRGSIDVSFAEGVTRLNDLQIALNNRLDQEVTDSREKVALLLAEVPTALEDIRVSANRAVDTIRGELSEQSADDLIRVKGAIDQLVSKGESLIPNYDTRFGEFLAKANTEFGKTVEGISIKLVELQESAEFDRVSVLEKLDIGRTTVMAALDAFIDSKKIEFESLVSNLPNFEDLVSPKFEDFLTVSGKRIDGAVAVSEQARAQLVVKLDQVLELQSKRLSDFQIRSGELEAGIATLREENVRSVDDAIKHAAEKVTGFRVDLFAGLDKGLAAHSTKFEQLASEVRSALDTVRAQATESVTQASYQVSGFTDTAAAELAKYRLDTTTAIDKCVSDAVASVPKEADLLVKLTPPLVDAVAKVEAEVEGTTARFKEALAEYQTETLAANSAVLNQLTGEIRGSTDGAEKKVDILLLETERKIQSAVVAASETLLDYEVQILAKLDKEVTANRAILEPLIGEVRDATNGMRLKADDILLDTKQKIQDVVDAASESLLNYKEHEVDVSAKLDKEVTANKAALELLVGEVRSVISGVQEKTDRVALGVTEQVREVLDTVPVEFAKYKLEVGAAIDKRADEHLARVPKVEELDKRFTALKDQLNEEIATEIASLITEERTRVRKILDDMPSAVVAPVVDISALNFGFDIKENENGHSFFEISLGGTVVAKKELRLPRYLGVYRRDVNHIVGDQVTIDGSTWMALVDSPTAEPREKIGEWKLIAKKGEKGRDGRDGHSVKTYIGHKKDTAYGLGDWLHLHNRVWQCVAEKTHIVPDAVDIRSTREWALIGNIQ